MNEALPQVDIVIVNWNSGDRLREALASLAASPEDLAAAGSVTVVDNDSRDGSADRLDQTGIPAAVLKNGRNAGFAAACNQGAALGRAPYVLLLNPDTRLEPGALSGALAFMDSEQGAGFGICGVQMVDEEGRISRSCARFPTARRMWMQILGLDRLFPKACRGVHMKDWDHANTVPVDHVIGAFYLVRRELYERLEGLDERFFVYLEDLDFSYRASLAGARCCYLAEYRIFHRGGGSSEKVKAHRLFYSLRSRILFVKKHFGWTAAWSVILGTLLIEPWIRLLFFVSKGQFAECGAVLQGYLWLFRSARSWSTGKGAAR